MKIAVVDDSAQDLSAEINYLTTYISNYHHGLSDDLKINGFQSAADFLKSFEPGKFDLIVLDIIMNDINGIQLAKMIRSKDRDCFIIFITNSTEFLIEGYSVFATGYFIKKDKIIFTTLNLNFENIRTLPPKIFFNYIIKKNSCNPICSINFMSKLTHLLRTKSKNFSHAKIAF